MKIALAQFNPTVGDVSKNAAGIIDYCIKAENLGATAIVFPELAICGYPPEDLLLRADFLRLVERELENISLACPLLTVIIGYPEKAEGALYNSVAVLSAGELIANYRKQKLPNYGVFDEKRYFSAGTQACVFKLSGIKVGLTICEDVWTAEVCQQVKQKGAKLILNLNASPFDESKVVQREQTIKSRIAENSLPVIYVNQVGGQDELVFDGASFAMNAQGEEIDRAAEFASDLRLVEFSNDQLLACTKTQEPLLERLPRIYQALVLGVRDYINKNGFDGAALGLSGGIDSALTLAIAADAIGGDRVEAVAMPSRYTADMSNEDALSQAKALGVSFQTIPIGPAVNAFTEMLAPAFAGIAFDPADVTEQNIQARCRGVLLMALSNKKRKILLTTGNKSEMSVGYATLYGDMAGGFAPIKDVPKMLVYELSKYRNTLGLVIPERVITRPPSAELAPDQKDEDSLPPYPVLDDILARYIEQDQARDEIVSAGFAAEVVDRVLLLVERNEYKRRQAPPGIKVTSRAFGRDRRYPITSGFSKVLLKR